MFASPSLRNKEIGTASPTNHNQTDTGHDQVMLCWLNSTKLSLCSVRSNHRVSNYSGFYRESILWLEIRLLTLFDEQDRFPRSCCEGDDPRSLGCPYVGGAYLPQHLQTPEMLKK